MRTDVHRRDKTNYYLDLAETVSQRCTCLRRHYGAVIVKNDEVISTGYVGAPRGRKNCTDLGTCVRQELHIPRGERYELCRSVHAEANAIISAPRDKMIDSTLYLVGKEVDTGEYVRNALCCSMCKRMVITPASGRWSSATTTTTTGRSMFGTGLKTTNPSKVYSAIEPYPVTAYPA